MSEKKVIVIGLDGARFDLIEKWANEGALPNFKKFIDGGCSGILKTVLPGPHSGPAWASFITGCNPGKHGIPYMTCLDETNKLKILTSKDIKCKKIWEYSNFKSIIMNIPVCAPPESINGIMISGGLTSEESEYTFPKKLKKILKEKFKYIPLANVAQRSKESTETIYNVLRKKISVSKWLIENEEWDLFISVFVETEQLHHLYSSFLDEHHHLYDPHFEEVVKESYKIIDEFLGFLLKKYNHQNTYIFIISDHGFYPLRRIIFMNNVLKRLGYAKISYFSILLRKLNSLLKKMINKNIFEIESLQLDMRKTIAFCPANIGGICLNRRIINKNTYEKIRNEIKNTLLSYDLVKNNIEKIYFKEEVFHGNNLGLMYDIIIKFKDGYNCSARVNFRKVDEKPKRIIGFHTMEGLFLVLGPQIQKKQKINAEIIDIAPTILYMFGIPIPRDMDGRVLKEIFEEDSKLAKREIIYDTEEEQIRRRIKELKSKGRI